MRRSFLVIAASVLLASVLAAGPAQAAVLNPADYSESGGCGGLAPAVTSCASQPWTAWTGSFGVEFVPYCPAGECLPFFGGFGYSVSGPSYYLEYDCSFDCKLVTRWGSVAPGDDLVISGWVYPHDACYRVYVTVPPHEPGVSVCPPMATGPDGFWGVRLV